jgi:NAD(P)-dependent dehydrogenase (short-subunit alcohol dehydrogenase family)
MTPYVRSPPTELINTLVTGAGAPNGIGFAIARAFALMGHSVTITASSDRIHDRSAELVELDLKVRSVVADLTNAADVERFTNTSGRLMSSSITPDWDQWDLRRFKNASWTLMKVIGIMVSALT